MATGKERRKLLAAKKAKKKSAMDTPGFKSHYARKVAYLKSHGGWGTDFAAPKPW